MARFQVQMKFAGIEAEDDAKWELLRLVTEPHLPDAGIQNGRPYARWTIEAGNEFLAYAEVALGVGRCVGTGPDDFRVTETKIWPVD